MRGLKTSGESRRPARIGEDRLSAKEPVFVLCVLVIDLDGKVGVQRLISDIGTLSPDLRTDSAHADELIRRCYEMRPIRC
jgi:hypothetical protein